MVDNIKCPKCKCITWRIHISNKCYWITCIACGFNVELAPVVGDGN